MVLNLGDADFTRYCEANPDLRIERTAEGSVLVLEHSGWENSNRNAEIIAELHGWSKRDCRGKALDAGVLYMLPNGAARSAHASWVLRFAARNPDDRSEARLSPYLPRLRGGASFTVRPAAATTRTVYVYRPGQTTERLVDPRRVEGEPPVDSFVLEMAGIWNPDL